MNGETMVGFGFKQAWLAVRDGRAEPVLAALGLRDLGPVSWRSGIDLAYLTDDRVVLTPPLLGAGGAAWLLVTGRWLTIKGPDVVELSARLGTEVQFFATHRSVELHRWERAVDGGLERSFQYEAGELIRWLGDPDAAELAFGLPPVVDDDASVLVGEADVMRVATAWSLDPTALAGQPAPGPLRAAATT